MRNIRITQRVLMLLIVCIHLTPLRSQTGGERMPVAASQARQMFGPPLFLFDSHYFFIDDSSKNGVHYRLNVYVAFANDILQFVKERQANFTASYELYARVFDHKGNLIAERNVGNTITVSDFKSTNDRELNNRHQLSFPLKAGRYKLALDLTDLDTQKSLHREQEYSLPKPDRSKVALSEIVFADQVIIDSLNQVQQLTPNLTRYFSDATNDFWAYFEIYPAAAGNDLKLSYLIRNTNDEVIANHHQSLPATRAIIPFVINLSKHVTSSGRFTIEVQVEQLQNLVRTQARFSTSWNDTQSFPLSLQTRIETLKEYATEKEFKNLLQAPDSLKSAWLKAFWKQRDPTPDTEYNELEQEFYRRVEFANNVFMINALDKEGWKTDRGAVYIKYGPPTEVERHQEQLNLPPYEIWYYSKLDQRFFFQDKAGLGDFQLVRIE